VPQDGAAGLEAFHALDLQRRPDVATLQRVVRIFWPTSRISLIASSMSML
jgi:hypothetical protein